MNKITLKFTVLWVLLATCTWSLAQDHPTISSIRLLDEYVLPTDFHFDYTRVGGLSGIDYDAANRQYYLISDDRSGFNPARFYTADIRLTDKGKIDTIVFTSVHTILRQNEKAYPSTKVDASLAPDPEAIRYNPRTQQLFWSNEGEKVALQDPSINVMNTEGHYVASITLPPNLSMKPGEKGPRSNGTIEGLAFNEDFSILYASMEEPLYEDGPRSEVKETNSWTRITAFDVASRKPLAQYAYKLEPLARAPFPSGTLAINGVTEILCVGRDQYLVVERSFSTGRLACTVNVFLADLSQAEDVLTVPSLTEKGPNKPVRKKLLLNMDDLGIFIDNIEGVTFGPRLPNGNRTLIFVADNNFQPVQRNQFLIFEVVP